MSSKASNNPPATPSVAPINPRYAASHSTNRSTCLVLAPTARNVANSRRRSNTAVTKVLTMPSTADTWCPAVLVEMNRCAAISSLLRPWLSCCRTSCSRLVRPAGWLRVVDRGAPVGHFAGEVLLEVRLPQTLTGPIGEGGDAVGGEPEEDTDLGRRQTLDLGVPQDGLPPFGQRPERGGDGPHTL